MSRRTTLVAAGYALNTVNALYPLGRGKPVRALASFACGMPTAELPLHVAGLQAAHLLARRRSMTPAALALTAASAIGTLALRARARRAAPVLDAAVAEALGTDYRMRSWHPRDAPAKAPGLLATFRAHGRYTHGTTNIPYGPAGHRNELDIWRRDDLPRDGRAPVLVQIHGGGWIAGDRTLQAYPLLSLMAERGWVCASVSYRLSPRATWPAQLDDVKAAIGYVRSTVAEHGGDPDFIAVTGGSAGGHLGMLAALDPDLDLQAAVALYAPTDWTNRAEYKHDLIGPTLARLVIKQPLNDETRDLYREASPQDQIHPDAPPFLVLAGGNDNLVSSADLRTFASELRAVSKRPVAFAELPGAWHEWDLFSCERSRATANAAADFLGAIRADHLHHDERQGEPVCQSN